MKILNLLYVDDNPTDVRLISEVLKLENLPISLSSVNDGAAAIEYVQQIGKYSSASKPDIIMLDLNLPKKSGFEVLEEIKKDPKLRSIPVLVFSTSAREKDINRSYDLQASAYIMKPTTLDGFYSLIRAIDSFWVKTASFSKLKRESMSQTSI